jgi:hypothetical protein
MAVVQISRIQQRRGKKNSNTGFPQLASGEIGWAIDTQELYIGNGAVSEGAPYVGNTQILTEHVNILDFAEAYQYQRNNPIIQTGPTFLQPVQRTLQERFDERVDIKSFIYNKNVAIGDDVTEDLQRAIDQLFLNDSTKANPESKVILYFGPGEYFISEELKIPPYCHLMGAGIDSTIIHLTGTGASGALMRMVDSNSTPGTYTPFASMSYTDARPKYITIERMTLKTDLDDTIVFLDNTDSSVFNQVKFEGNYDNGGQPLGSDPTDTAVQTGIYSRSTSGVHRPESVQFNSCIFYKTGFGFYSKTDHNDIGFHYCLFYQLYDGIIAGGDVFGAVNTKVEGCHFDLIDRHGIWIKLGYGNTSSNNKFMLVGNNNEGYANATYPIIRYDTTNNQSINDYFERNSKLKDQTIFGLIPFHPNVKTSGLVVDPTNFVKILETTPSIPIEFFRFPIHKSATYVIDYVINKNSLGSSIRTGTIHLTVDYPGSSYHIQDDYTYVGSSTVENIEFSADIKDYDNDFIKETLVLKMWNPTGNGIGTMNYTYHTITQ